MSRALCLVLVLVSLHSVWETAATTGQISIPRPNTSHQHTVIRFWRVGPPSSQCIISWPGTLHSLVINDAWNQSRWHAAESSYSYTCSNNTALKYETRVIDTTREDNQVTAFLLLLLVAIPMVFLG